MTSLKDIKEKVENLQDFVRYADNNELSDMTYYVDTSELSISGFTYSEGEISDIAYDCDDVTVAFSDEDTSIVLNVDEWYEIRASVDALAKEVQEVKDLEDDDIVLVDKTAYFEMLDAHNKIKEGTHTLIEKVRLAEMLGMLEEYKNKEKQNQCKVMVEETEYRLLLTLKELADSFKALLRAAMNEEDSNERQ